MKKKMMKVIKELNAYIDNDREKLCDRVHELELSHKRMERLLRECLRVFDSQVSFGMIAGKPFNTDWIADAIKRELSYPYFRVQYRMKGGKKCVDV